MLLLLFCNLEWGMETEVVVSNDFMTYDITEIVITAKVMLPNQGFLVVNEKSSLGKLYCRHHDLDNRYAVSVSQMITDMFRLS